MVCFVWIFDHAATPFGSKENSQWNSSSHSNVLFVCFNQNSLHTTLFVAAQKTENSSRIMASLLATTGGGKRNEQGAQLLQRLSFAMPQRPKD